MKVLTSSSLSTFRDCPRKYVNQYDLGRVPIKESAALKFGKIWHSALETWWMHDLEATIEKLNEMADGITEEDAAKIAALLQFYSPPNDLYEVIGVEVPFGVKIENPVSNGRSFYGYRLAGKVDVLLKEKTTGSTWIVDHKTTTKEIIGFGPYWQNLQIDGQMNNYCLAFNARGFIYDAVKRPMIKLCGKDEKAAKDRDILPATAYQERCEAVIEEDLEVWYQWREHLKGEDDYRKARRDLWQQVEMFRSCDSAGWFPRNPNACQSLYGTCPYIDVCTDRANIDDDTLFRTKTAVHEELEETA